MTKVCLILTIILISCNNKTDKKKDVKELVNSKSEIMRTQDSLSFQNMMLLNKSEAIKKYGTPSSQEQFILDDLQGEFRIGLYNIFTKEERLSESILIDEVTWEKDKDTWITVWYQVIEKTSKPKDVYIWKKGTEF